MPIDRQLYDRQAADWWDERKALSGLRGLNPVRFGYFRRVVVDTLGRDPTGLSALDIGCGGGLLAEEFARLGCHVTGIDPSGLSIEAAKSHALGSGMAIDYRVGAGEALPFGDNTFDVVYCCDVLEHVDDLNSVIGESSRVLKQGGIYFYDTINRTWLSNLVIVKLMQDWKATRAFDAKVHDWRMFIKPTELLEALRRHNLQPQPPVGIKLTGSPLRLFGKMRRFKSGKIPAADVLMGSFGESPDLRLSYMGYALKESD